jgi:hypothetical protein
LKFTALNGGLWNLVAKTLQVFKSKQIGSWLAGEEGQGIAGQIPVRGGVRGGEELAHEHQELKARLLEVLGRGRDDRIWGSHGGPKRRRRGARWRGVS